MEKCSFIVKYDRLLDDSIIIESKVAYDTMDITGGAWQFVLSTDVNVGISNILGKMKSWARTVTNRLFRRKMVDEVIEPSAEHGDVTGWSIGRMFDGRYYDRKSGHKFDEKSFTVEIRGITERVAEKLANALAKKFDQESVLMVDLQKQRSSLMYASDNSSDDSVGVIVGSVIRGIKYQDIAHGAGSVVWWIKNGKMFKHISQGTMKDMHHNLDKNTNMDSVWRGRSTKPKNGVVSIMPPIGQYSRSSGEIPGEIMREIERELNPTSIVMDTAFGLKRVAVKRK